MAKLFDASIFGESEGALELISNILQASTEYCIIGKDLDRSIVLWNEGARPMYGYDTEEIVSKANPENVPTAENVFGPGAREYRCAGATGTGGPILVVNHTQVNRDVVQSTLAPLGYRVTLAASVADAHVMVARESFDLVASDVHMPNADGYQFISEVKADSRLRSIPFMFVGSSVRGQRGCRTRAGHGRRASRDAPIEPERPLQQMEGCLRRRTEQ